MRQLGLPGYVLLEDKKKMDVPGNPKTVHSLKSEGIQSVLDVLLILFHKPLL